MNIRTDTIALLVTVVSLAIGGGAYVGQLAEKLNALNPEEIAEYREELSEHIETELPSGLAGENLPPGSILASVIEPEVMEVHAPKWRLADGRAVEPDWTYRGIDGYLPNLQNVFLRGMPRDNSRAIGSKEDHATARPRNELSVIVSESGEHSHEYKRDIGRQGLGWSKGSGYARDDNVATRMVETSGLHSHPAELEGWDAETRPVNVAVYFYIKVD